MIKQLFRSTTLSVILTVAPLPIIADTSPSSTSPRLFGQAISNTSHPQTAARAPRNIYNSNTFWPGIAPEPAQPDSAYECAHTAGNTEGSLQLISRKIFSYDSWGRPLFEHKHTSMLQHVFVDENTIPLDKIIPGYWNESSRIKKNYLPNGLTYTDELFDKNNDGQFTSDELYSRDVEGKDAAGRTTLTENWRIDTDQLIMDNKSVTRYDNAGNTLLLEIYSWNQEINAIQGSARYTSAFDTRGNEIEHAAYHWNPSSLTWENSVRWENDYDTEGFPTQMSTKKWKNDTWVETEKGTASHNPTTKTITFAMQKLVENKWVDNGSGTITYLNSFKTPLTQENTYYDQDKGETITSRKVYTYDSSNRETSSESYIQMNGNWILIDGSTKSYDAAGRIVEETTLGSYKTRNEYTYNSVGDITENNQYNKEAEQWVLNTYQHYTYDASRRCTSRTVASTQFDDKNKQTRTFDSSGRILTEANFQYDDRTQSFLEIRRTKYFHNTEVPISTTPFVEQRTATSATIQWNRVQGAIGYTLKIYDNVSEETPIATYSLDQNGEQTRAADDAFRIVVNLSSNNEYYARLSTINQYGTNSTSASLLIAAYSTTGIEQEYTKQLRAYSANGYITIDGLEQGTPYSIYNSIGAMEIASSIANNSRITQSLPAGIYIIRTAKQAVKVIVRE